MNEIGLDLYIDQHYAAIAIETTLTLIWWWMCKSDHRRVRFLEKTHWRYRSMIQFIICTKVSKCQSEKRQTFCVCLSVVLRKTNGFLLNKQIGLAL